MGDFPEQLMKSTANAAANLGNKKVKNTQRAFEVAAGSWFAVATKIPKTVAATASSGRINCSSKRWFMFLVKIMNLIRANCMQKKLHNDE